MALGFSLVLGMVPGCTVLGGVVGHNKLIKGLIIGGAVDAILVVSALWLFLEIQDHTSTVY